MPIARSRPYGPIDEERLRAFERKLPSQLPDDYRAFLLEHNGANFVDAASFDEIPGGTELETLFGLHTGPTHTRLDELREQCANAVPATLLLIGSDPYGNYFGLELAGERRGAVFFVDHEQLPVDVASLKQVAPSFSVLLDRAGRELVERAAPRSVLEAIEQGDPVALGVLLREDCDAAGFVHRAVRTQSVEIVRLVLEHGGDPDERGGIGGSETPLFLAARNGNAEIARLLLARGADPNARCGAGGTAMEMASCSPKVLEILARAGATPTTRHLRDAVRRILGR